MKKQSFAEWQLEKQSGVPSLRASRYKSADVDFGAGKVWSRDCSDQPDDSNNLTQGTFYVKLTGKYILVSWSEWHGGLASVVELDAAEWKSRDDVRRLYQLTSAVMWSPNKTGNRNALMVEWINEGMAALAGKASTRTAPVPVLALASCGGLFDEA